MYEPPRPSEVGDEATPRATAVEQAPSAPEQAHDHDAAAAGADVPSWLTLASAVVFALVIVYLVFFR